MTRNPRSSFCAAQIGNQACERSAPHNNIRTPHEAGNPNQYANFDPEKPARAYRPWQSGLILWRKHNKARETTIRIYVVI